MDLKIIITQDKPKKRLGVISVTGQISIGNFKESLYMPLDWWSIDDYKQQWQEGLARLSNHDTSCLVTTIHDPYIRPFVNWWLLYKVNSKIYVRNSLLVGDIYADRIGNHAITPLNCYDFIYPRVTSRRTSEWVIDYTFH